jgi:phage anti-repressor protein
LDSESDSDPEDEPDASQMVGLADFKNMTFASFVNKVLPAYEYIDSEDFIQVQAANTTFRRSVFHFLVGEHKLDPNTTKSKKTKFFLNRHTGEKLSFESAWQTLTTPRGNNDAFRYSINLREATIYRT